MSISLNILIQIKKELSNIESDQDKFMYLKSLYEYSANQLGILEQWSKSKKLERIYPKENINNDD